MTQITHDERSKSKMVVDHVVHVNPDNVAKKEKPEIIEESKVDSKKKGITTDSLSSGFIKK